MEFNYSQLELISQNQSNLDNSHFEQWFEDLIYYLRPLIYRKIRYITNNHFELEDIFQDIIIKLYRALQSFDFSRGISFEHYIFLLICSVKYDYFRKLKADNHRYPRLINEYVVDYHCALAINDIERSILRKELSAMFDIQSQTLSQMEKSIIQLLLKDYKLKEIATILEVKEKVVYNAIHRCKIKFKREFKN